MMTLRLRLIKVDKEDPTRIKFNLDKLKDRGLGSLPSKIVGKFAPLLLLSAENTAINTKIDTFNSSDSNSQ